MFRLSLVFISIGMLLISNFGIAQSRPHHGSTNSHQIVHCESVNNRHQVCQTGWAGAVLVRQYSRSACIEGQSWGHGSGSLWVSNGCRADFGPGRFGPHRPGNNNNNRPGWGGNNNSNRSIVCSSDNNRVNSCSWDRRWGRPFVAERLSRNSCNENRDWSFDGSRITVRNGCRARFQGR